MAVILEALKPLLTGLSILQVTTKPPVAQTRKAAIRLALLPRPGREPSARLLDALQPCVLNRAAVFLSAKRRLEYLWSRVLLHELLLHEPQAVVVESPPRSPHIENAAFSHTTISHTRTWIGAGVGTLPFAIDLEVMDAARVRKELFTRLFDPRHWSDAEPAARFYRFFGMYEAAVKMNLPFHSNVKRPYVGHSEEKACSVRFLRDETTLLTLVSRSEAALHLSIFEADAEGGLHLSSLEPFAPFAP